MGYSTGPCVPLTAPHCYPTGMVYPPHGSYPIGSHPPPAVFPTGHCPPPTYPALMPTGSYPAAHVSPYPATYPQPAVMPSGTEIFHNKLFKFKIFIKMLVVFLKCHSLLKPFINP